jgi:hypothetical protein
VIKAETDKVKKAREVCSIVARCTALLKQIYSINLLFFLTSKTALLKSSNDLNKMGYWFL